MHEEVDALVGLLAEAEPPVQAQRRVELLLADAYWPLRCGAQRSSHYATALLLQDALALLFLVDPVRYELPQQGLVADALDGRQSLEAVYQVVLHPYGD